MGELAHRSDFDFNRQTIAPQHRPKPIAEVLTLGFDKKRSNRIPVIVLDQDLIPQTETMISAASLTHRIFFKLTPQRRGFPGIVNLGTSSLHLAYKLIR